MRSLRVILVGLILLIWAASAQANWSSWQEYTTIEADNKPFITLEVRTFYANNYPPRAQWRATNRSQQTLYCAEIGRQRYILAHGHQVIGAPQGCRTMAPGETAVYPNEVIGKKGQRIAQMAMDVFSFDLEKGKNRQRVPLN